MKGKSKIVRWRIPALGRTGDDVERQWSQMMGRDPLWRGVLGARARAPRRAWWTTDGDRLTYNIQK